MMFLVCALFVAVALSCRSGYVSKSGNVPSQSYSSCPASIARQLIGNRDPCGERQCSRCASGLTYNTASRNFGRFTVRAHQGFLSVLVQVFNDMSSSRPDLFRRITSAGAVCCRLIKRVGGGCGSGWSNHAFGSAIDIMVDGVLDAYGDGCIHRPLLEIAPFFMRRGLYWGAAFSNEDSMHFEMSRQLAQQWISNGVPNVGDLNAPSAPIVADDNTGGPITSDTPCTYRGQRGGCLATATCSSKSGQSFSSRIGASGCQSLPADIKCCIAGAQLLEGETGDETPQDFEIEDDADAPALEGGEIAGIVIGVLILLLIVGGVVFFVRAKRQERAFQAQSAFEAAAPTEMIAPAPANSGEPRFL